MERAAQTVTAPSGSVFTKKEVEEDAEEFGSFDDYLRAFKEEEAGAAAALTPGGEVDVTDAAGSASTQLQPRGEDAEEPSTTSNVAR